MLKFLLLIGVLATTLAAAAQDTASPRVAPQEDRHSLSMDQPTTSAVLRAPSSSSDILAQDPSSDRVCYKIRAYLFRKDDDRAPKYVGSTTCQPRPSDARDAKLPAHLEPLK